MMKAFFLDRDGVICKALGGYLTKLEEFELLPGIKEFITKAKQKGYLVIVVTNQPQIAKGLLTEEALLRIHSKTRDLLDNQIDEIYYCPHINEDNCECRKPKSGMLLTAQKDLGIDLEKSIIVGDSDKDILAGQRVGCKTIFIKNEFNDQRLKNCSPDIVINNLSELLPLI